MSKPKFWDLKIKNSVKPADTPVEPVENQASDKVEAELFLYGDVVETTPVDWWTGETVDGEYIAQDEFVQDIRSLKTQGVTDLTVHINSCGGNLYTGSAIHNLLKEMVDHVTVIIEGIAASAATVIAVAGDTVKMMKNGLFMIHEPSISGYLDNATAEDAEKLKAMLDAGAESAATAYAEKTGMSVKALRKLMKEETWMTGEEALEKGFVDELIDGEVVMSMSADGLNVNGDTVTIKDFTNIPENIKTMMDDIESDDINDDIDPDEEPDDDINPDSEEIEDADPDDGEVENDIDVEIVELKDTPESIEAAFPEIVNQIREEAIKEERARMKAIDEIVSTVGMEMAMKAKYETPMSAEKLALESVRAGINGASSFLEANAKDVQASNTSEVAAVPSQVQDTTDNRKRLAMKIAGVEETKEGGTN